MKIYEKYDNIITFDDKLFYKNNLILSCLSVNKFEYYKNSEKKIDFYFENNKPNRELIRLQNIFIFIFNRGKQSAGNFFHFHFHYLQKILGFFLINDENIKLGIPLNMTPFQKNIILKLVPEDKIIYLDIYKYNYEIKNCYVGNYINIHSIPDLLLDKYQIIGNKIIFNNLIKPKYENNIFISRKINDNAGSNRYITNYDEFTKFIETKKFKLFYFEDYNLENKLIKLISLNPKLILIENGSGLTNFLFFPKNIIKNIHLIILDQENWKINTSRIYDIILKFEIKHDILTCKNIINDENDIRNNPFNIDISEFENIYNKFTNAL
tara:strand:- start:95 stop:1066 length:972 start_codon:yes stop_codon:yes gene_type:complete